MFLIYLTDRDTVATFKRYAATYGKEIKSVIENQNINQTNNLLNKPLASLKPLVQKMSETIGKGLKMPQPENKGGDNFQTDKAKAQEIINKYNTQK
jgi:hypothetical protein